ncbi:MAG: nucleoid-associated protein [Chitinophagaceae bacterium]|nr:nucleoid-associated protein [Chitinophagaceae bacterium]
MIDFNNLNVRKIIIHTINPKQNGQDTASAEFSNEILEIEDNVLAIIKVRLIDAAGRNSKAFELQIENTNTGSFFNLSKELNELSNENFITVTSEIANLLADSQRKTSIPGGYLMIMNCIDDETNLPVHIVIKAEP